MARIDGTAGSDTLRGTGKSDTIFGHAGSDNIAGLAGDDSIYGHDGDDTIDGGDGIDAIWGGNGNDIIIGGLGDDRTLDGQDGNDIVRGGLGHDSITGGGGDDVVFGDEGNDRVQGAHGIDVLYGGDGNDVIQGGLGADELWGGSGSDTFFFYEQDSSTRWDWGYPTKWTASDFGVDTIMDFESGIDKIDLSAIDANLTTDITYVRSKGGTTAVGNDSFRLVEAPSGAAGELTLTLNEDGSTTINCFLDADTVPDMTIIVLAPITPADFIF